MISYVLDAAALEDVTQCVVVVGHGATWVEKSLSERVRRDEHLTFVEQREQLGTGHAVSVALATVDEAMGDDEGDVVILPGDAPLLRRATLEQLVSEHRERHAAISVLSALVEDPTGYGRIVRSRDGSLARIVEERDATPDERNLREINTSIMVVRHSVLGPALRRVGRHNAQREYYLTDLVEVLHEAGHVSIARMLDDPSEAHGVNDRAQLARAEEELRRRINDAWMRRGVTMWDPERTYVDADVELAEEVSLLPGTVLRGHCIIERGAQIGPGASLRDTRVGEGARIDAAEVNESVIERDAHVESFVVLHAGALVRAGERVSASR